MCPYIENGVMAVRADGSAVPCLEYMYPHMEYVNHHSKDIGMMTFGNVKGQTVKGIWNGDEYISFRESRRFIDEKDPVVWRLRVLHIGLLLCSFQ